MKGHESSHTHLAPQTKTWQRRQSQGDWALHETSGGVVLAAWADSPTVSAHIQNGEVYIDCPANYKGYQAVLVPIADRDPAAYEVRFVNSFDNLPSGTQFGSWYLSDDRLGLANSNFTKVVNAVSGWWLDTGEVLGS